MLFPRTYALVVAKGGSKLIEGEAASPTVAGRNSHRVRADDGTMTSTANLAVYLERQRRRRIAC